jgi:hypothetical protein
VGATPIKKPRNSRPATRELKRRCVGSNMKTWYRRQEAGTLASKRRRYGGITIQAGQADGGILSPQNLIRMDTSMKEEDKVFGIDMARGEAKLQDDLCPPPLSNALAKSLINAAVDVVSMPGRFFGGGDSETLSKMSVLGEAMAELVNQKGGMAETSG